MSGADRCEVFGPGGVGFPPELFGDAFCGEDLQAHFPVSLAFLDIETCGLGDVLVFLVGVMTCRPPGPLCFESFFAPDPSREPELLEGVAARLAGVECWVSFNGKTFDVPRLRKRAFRHGLEIPGCPAHIDLLYEVRRRWKSELPDCRLSTVERRLLGLERGPGDIPGREVPDHYWDWVSTGDDAHIEPIREHNRRDVAAMVVLLDRLVREGALDLMNART